MPRLIAILLCCVLAAPAWGQDIGPTHPVMMGARNGLVRAGLVGAWNLGTQNEVLYSEDFSNAAWTKTNASATATVLTATADGGTVTQSKASLSTKAYTFKVELKRKTGTGTVSVQMKAGTVQACTINATDYAACTITYTTSGVETLVYGVLFAANTDEVYARYAQLNEGDAALAYVATTDLQTVPNLVAGGPALQLGSTSGADTNDPVRRLSGMTFSTDDYLDSSVSLPTPNATFYAVVSPTNTGGNKTVVGNYPGLGGYVSRVNDSGDLQVFLVAGDSGVTISSLLPQGEFASFAIGASGTTISAFKNGIFASGGTVTNPLASGKTVRVGVWGNSDYYSGTISHVLLYNRALSPAEVRRNHNTYLKPAMANVGVTLP